MKKLLLVPLLAVASPAFASVLTFDDLGSGQGFFLSNYHGFTFGTNNIATTAWFHSDEVSSFYKPHSGTIYIATDFQLYTSNPVTTTQPISNPNPFVFNGAYFTGGDPVHYLLYLGNTLVYTSSDSATLTATPMFVSSGYSGLVNSVVIYGRQGYYALDDFTYNEVAVNPAAVPEVASWAMFIGGFGAMGGMMRYRRRTAKVVFA